MRRTEVYVGFKLDGGCYVEITGGGRYDAYANPTEASLWRLVRTVRKMVKEGHGCYQVFAEGWSWTAK